ncbi:ABC transporter ATP-binding protein [Brevibacillus borstelensis]|uniref:ABC transporter ATP-binding protein n=1 Tax=Brevibacillus borstelensis TaxID=45462 RepID=UPI000F08A964|nr:dipeptide ABC transporter ATP-binding protein [Brevibacillus borstelensis]MBE5394785.1 dipeptide ABC transporter ATP-binding protein [Brevibacillus borstelensis]MCC0566599.1 dipeptide ABC transporter ATP-binding protein [Brevibacillus borstelensis]MCM3472252.1 dipeptide ABC transporter ATP-binding protein [Brevibacillus borstelensis]MCM3560661.1 dipeptide ABC transporter ATP-binding protein [Brevibacillus borstelensis]MCM3593117.1 dipeptide ABC transporter ATP-binding protein [Brevibacillus
MKPLLEVKDLKKHYPIKKGLFGKQVGAVKAVDGVSFSIQPGETLGIVGESGCGKSTTGRAILRLIEPTAGEVLFDGQDIRKLPPDEMRKFRTNMQIVFQDPYASLDPRWTVQRTLEEPLRTHLKLSEAEIKDRIAELMSVVGLAPYHASRFPHEFSGGQRQRIGIARALALRPKFVVCDEPVSALDVSIQAQVLNLMQDLQSQFSLTYMFISHDLSVVKFICDRVGVMYLGRMVEMAPTAEMFAEPLHPYTKALMSAVPVPDPEAARERIVLTGDVPNPQSPPTGCTFHTRCPYVMDSCRQAVPEWREVSPGRHVACHLFEQ